MYTVLSIWDLNESQMLLLTEGNLFFADLHGPIEKYKNTRASNCYTFGIADNDNWFDHHEEVFHALTKLAPALKLAKELGATLEIDTGIFGDDYKSRLLTTIYWKSDLLQLAAQFDISFMFSIYYAGNNTEEP